MAVGESDAAGAPEATAIADADAGNGPATYCSTLVPAATFCADFDEPGNASPSAGWDTSSVDGGASVSVTVSTTTYESAPRSLHVTATGGGSGVVTKRFAMNSKIRVDLDVLFTAHVASPAAVAPLRLTPPVYPGMDVYLFAASAGIYFQEYGNDFSTMLPSPTLNAWHHVIVSITTIGTTSTIDASFDGTAAWSGHTLADTWPAPTTATLDVGLPDLYQAADAEVFVDNVVVRVQ